MDLGAGLRKALAKITGAAIVDEKAVAELVKELQRVLISNDVNVKLVFELSKKIQERALKEKPAGGIGAREHVVKVVYDELVALMGEKHEPKLNKQKILLLGLFGSGKTTTTAKLAKFYRDRGLSVGLICCDTYRPAAYEQVEQLAAKTGVPFYGIRGESDVKKIVKGGLEHFKEKDVVIVDSSGRDAFDGELSKELKDITDTLRPDEKFLIVSADIGQIAKKEAEEFNKVVDVTGVVVTKMDGSGKGGGALSSVAASGAKVAFIGTGEKLDDFEVFDAKKFVGRLLGFPDLEALLEKVKNAGIEEEVKAEKILEEELTIESFYEQLKATKKLGPLKSIFQMMGMVDVPKELMEQSEEKLKRYEVIISSMTKNERKDVDLVRKNRGRMERIAKGSGTSVEDVRDLIAQFEKMKKFLDAFKKNRGLRRQVERFMKGGAGKLG
ncbi:MAG: signal recognition particle receptor subunit alpha [Candidatus Micrarchaeota archaeon]|nr:signal recognition particle receptor subunit alpha [Candidatus Micrarchaeota archaeon]